MRGSKSPTRPLKSLRACIIGARISLGGPITIKFHVRAPLLAGAGKPATVLLNTRSEKRLQQKCASVRAERAAGRANQIADGSTAQVSTVFARPIARLAGARRWSILVGLLNAYPRARTVARPEDRIEVRRRDESKISRGPMRLLRVSPPTKLRAVLSVLQCAFVKKDQLRGAYW